MSLTRDSKRSGPRASRDSGAEGDAGDLDRISEYMQSADQPRTTEERQQALDELIDIFERLCQAGEERGARKAEVAFLLLLRDEQEILEDEVYREFVANCLEQKSFYQITWNSVEDVIRVAEVLYAFHYDEEVTPDKITRDVRNLVRHALRQFEREDRHEDMFALMQRAPLPSAMMDADLVRLRNRVHLYEGRRVARKRRYLYAFLLLQLLLVFLIFPLLFRSVENGQIQRQVEEATGLEIVDGRIQCSQTGEDVDCEEEPDLQFFSLADSLYWSVITYASIGYGDVIPVTDIGKILAGIHGVMGVLTTGIIAGLVLNWVSPRSLSL